MVASTKYTLLPTFTLLPSVWFPNSPTVIL